jgi:hypothetical protein
VSTEGGIAAAVMVILGLAWLALPILRRRYAISGEELARQKEHETLLTLYERTLSAIRDLDEDHLTGKLAQADYEAERAYWTERGVAVLQALEKTGGRKPAHRRKTAYHRQPLTAGETDADAALDDAIERAISSYIKSTR